MKTKAPKQGGFGPAKPSLAGQGAASASTAETAPGPEIERSFALEALRWKSLTLAINREVGIARRDVGKVPGDPRRSGSVPAATGPTEGAPDTVQVRLRFNAEQWRDITRCASHDQETPEKWLRIGALEWVAVNLDEIQRKAERDKLMLKLQNLL